MPLEARHFPICALKLGVALWLSAVVFSAMPQIDISMSRLFFDPVLGFWMAKDEGLLVLREWIWTGCLIALIGAAVAWAYSLRWGPVAGIPARIWGFVVMLHVFGPGLLANVILKGHWGRARPTSILEFGGAQSFTPALEPAQECARNCSFVSGEGAMVSAMLISGLILARYVICPKRRRQVMIVLWGVAITGMALRVMMGRHFLSDTIFAGLLVALVAVLIRPFFAKRAVLIAPGPVVLG